MCNIQKINNALEVLEAASNQSELIEKCAKEYKNQNFKMALDMAAIVLKAALEGLALNPDFLYSELYKGECKLVFIKADGSERAAIATLSESHGAPSRKGKAAIKADPKRAHLLTFFDIEKGAMRSCKIESIKTFKRILKGGV